VRLTATSVGVRHVAGNRREACASDLVAEREHADIGVEARRDVEPAGNRGVASDVGGLSVLLLLLACCCCCCCCLPPPPPQQQQQQQRPAGQSSSDLPSRRARSPCVNAGRQQGVAPLAPPAARLAGVAGRRSAFTRMDARPRQHSSRCYSKTLTLLLLTLLLLPVKCRSLLPFRLARCAGPPAYRTVSLAMNAVLYHETSARKK
jgi:hypothetical protein